MSKDTFKYAHVDFTGMRFGRLTVVEKADHGRSWWKCKCDCGNEKEVVAYRLFELKSCGCYEKENLKKIGKNNKTHGMTDTRLYHVYSNIHDRCYNPNYKYYHRYGGRGITVCEEWKHSFENFYKWAIESGYDESKSGKEQSLDRIDVNGNYEPSNCRWVTQKQQMHNIGRTVYMEYNGEKVPMVEFCEENGISYPAFARRRLDKGFSAEQILLDWNIKNNNSDYMTVSQASDYYGVCYETIRSWIKKGILFAEKHGESLYIPKGQEVITKSK